MNQKEDKHKEKESIQQASNAQSKETVEKKNSCQRKKNSMVRTTLRIMLWIFLLILSIPVLIYIPPIQILLKNVACSVASDATGMHISIERFSLKFPLDVALEEVLVIESTGDTMIKAKEAIVDVKLRPLLDLDVQLRTLQLREGLYRMVNADSSMILKAKLGSLIVEGNTGMNLNTGDINLSKIKLKDGQVSLFMNVWKAKQEDKDSTSTLPYKIKVDDIDIENLSYAMSMLPTIDTLNASLQNLSLKNGVIDLRNNKIHAQFIGANGGDINYIVPTQEYIAAHPAPTDTLPKQASVPMIIRGDSISITDINAKYAVQGTSPNKGFDANYIVVNDFGIEIEDFYNRGNELRVPIRQMILTERSGLKVTQTSGVVGIDSLGIAIDKFHLSTVNSQIDIDGYVSYAMMAMEKYSPVRIASKATIGFTDVIMYMPAISSILVGVPKHRPLEMILNAEGNLSSLDINVLSVSIPDFMSLACNGFAKNLYNVDQLVSEVEVVGNIQNTSYLSHFIEGSGVEVPSMRIVGNASINSDNYHADLQVLTPSGEITFDGDLSLNSEGYFADLVLTEMNLAAIMPDLGIGLLSSHIKAEGNGFDIMNPKTTTDITAEISQLEYGERMFGNIEAEMSLNEGRVIANLISYDPYCDFDVTLDGRLNDDMYEFDASVNLQNVDLQELGFSETMNSGSGQLKIIGWAKPVEWLYQVDLEIDNFNWNLPGQYIHLPNGLRAKLDAEEDRVNLDIMAHLLEMHYNSSCRLDSMLNQFSVASDSILADIGRNQLNIKKIQSQLPKFDLMLNASGKGLLKQFLAASDVSMDSIVVGLKNQDKIIGGLGLFKLKSGSLRLDTISLDLSERGRLIDYHLHVGNRKGTLDEFAKIDLKGYFGGNRASASLTQRNIEGKIGYRLGFTAAIQTDAISLHFTPLESTIAYLPWVFNEDNYLQYNLNGQVDANLMATSDDSHIKLLTIQDEDGNNALTVNVANLKIQDFLNLSAFAPPITGSFNSDMLLKYKNNAILGSGILNIEDMTYDRMRLGTFDFNFKAGLDMSGNTGALLSLLVDGEEVMTGKGYIIHDSIATQSRSKIDLTLKKFPLILANPFLGKDVAELKGTLNGELEMNGELISPKLNGEIFFDHGSIYLPIMGTTLKLDSIPVVVKDNVINFQNYNIKAANENPLIVNGNIDARNLSKIGVDIDLSARNMQLVGTTKKSKSDIYGKLFANLTASAKGDLSTLDINADLSVLSSTDIYYTMPNAESVIAEQTNGEIVKFVVLADSVDTALSDSVASLMNMKISANLNIMQGAKATVNLSANGTDKVEILPSGNLVFSQNYMGDMRLNGQLNVHDGYARYNVPIMGEKKFTFQPNSYILWNGDLMNPMLNFHAVDKVKTNVKQDNQNSRVVNFDVLLSVTNTLSSPKILFDLSTEDDISIQNELQSMSVDQRSNQAMNLLLYNTYTGSSGNSSANFSAEGQLYSFLTSQLNSWAAKTVQGVDLSFGIDQYNQTIDGQNSSSMSYSYQVSKSLFDNKFKIVVGGNYTTDASADENFAQNLISDISFEYTIKQTRNLTLYAKLFRHTGYESILEGEITETGAGLVMKRRLDNLKSLFRFRRPKRKNQEVDSIPIDTIRLVIPQTTNQVDSLDGFDVEPINEGYDVLN